MPGRLLSSRRRVLRDPVPAAAGERAARRQEVACSAGAVQVRKSLESENQHLRQLLAMRERVARDFIAAEIL